MRAPATGQGCPPALGRGFCERQPPVRGALQLWAGDCASASHRSGVPSSSGQGIVRAPATGQGCPPALGRGLCDRQRPVRGALQLWAGDSASASHRSGERSSPGRGILRPPATGQGSAPALGRGFCERQPPVRGVLQSWGGGFSERQQPVALSSSWKFASRNTLCGPLTSWCSTFLRPHATTQLCLSRAKRSSATLSYRPKSRPAPMPWDSATVRHHPVARRCGEDFASASYQGVGGLHRHSASASIQFGAMVRISGSQDYRSAAVLRVQTTSLHSRARCYASF